MIRLEKLSKYYASKSSVGLGLSKVDLELNIGEFVVITGESGSGKSTLLNIISGQDTYEEGELFIFDEETSHFNISDWEDYRANYIGSISQNYNIIESYTVLQNVLVALELQNYPKKQRRQRANELIEQVGLTHRIHHKAGKLSGGEKQRTVIARALAKSCAIIVADEPTGNLDSESSEQIIKLLFEVSKDKLVVLVTHNYEEVAEFATRRIRIKDGEIVEDRLLKETKALEDNVVKSANSEKKFYLSTILKSAFRNLIATPKRLLFLLSLQVVVVGIFMFIYAFLMSSADLLVRETAPASDSSHQVSVVRRDDMPISIEEFSEFDIIRSISLYETSYSAFKAIGYLSEDPITGSYPIGEILMEDASVLNEGDLSAGTLPEINEVVLSDIMMQLYDLKVGDEVVLLRIFTKFTQSPGTTFVISGSTLRGSNETVYLNNEIFVDKEIALNGLLSTVNKKVTFFYLDEEENMRLESMSFGKIIFDDTLEPGTMIIPIHLLPDPMEVQPLGYSLLIGPYYEESIKYDFTTEQVIKTEDGNSNLILSTSYMDDLISLYFGEDYLPIKLTLNVHDLVDGKILANDLDHDIYRVFYNVTSPQTTEAILTQKQFELASYVIVASVGILLYTILGVVTKNINISRKNDFSIFRSIGANRPFLAKQVMLEQVLSGSFAFVLVVIIFQIAARYNYMVSETMRYLFMYQYVILFIISVLLSIQVAGRNNKKIFEFSIISALNSEVEEIL